MNRHAPQQLAGTILLLLTLLLPTRLHAAPASQDDPVAQCAEGVRLFDAGDDTAALPFLEAGFAGRDKSDFSDLNDLGMCALALGVLLYNSNDWGKSLEVMSVAQKQFYATGNRTLEAIAFDWIGGIYSSQARYELSLDAYQQALSIWRDIGNNSSTGNTLNQIGWIYQERGLYAKALTFHQQALAIAREMGSRKDESSALNNIGALYDAQSQHVEALEVYQQALIIQQEIGDRVGESTTLDNIGVVYLSQGLYDKALEYHQKSLTIKEETDKHASAGVTLNNIGVVYDAQGRYTEALNSYQQALVIAREIGNRAREAATLSNIAGIYEAQGNYGLTLDALQQSLQITREVGNRFNEGVMLNNMGAIYSMQGQYVMALDTLQQALKIRQEVGDRSGEASTLNSIGGVYDDQGKYTQALEIYQKALTVRLETGDRIGEGITLNNIGVIYGEQKQYAQAIDMYQQALFIAQETASRRLEGRIFNNTGKIYEKQKLYMKAIDIYQQALIIAQEVDNHREKGVTLKNIGIVYEKQGHYPKALASYEQAMIALEDVRANAGDDMGRASFIAQHADLYEHAAALYLQQGQPEAAFRTAERGRARTFLDGLATGYVQLNDDAANALRQQEQEAYNARQAAQDALSKARAAAEPDTDLVRELEQQLADAEAAYSTAQDAITSSSAELAALVPGRSAAAQSLAQIQAQLDPDTTLLTFFVTEDSTLAFVVTASSFSATALPIARSELDRLVRTLRQFDAPDAPASELYAQLIAPLRDQLTTPHLAIVPHGILHYLPFAALSPDGQQLLGDAFLLSILPSASVLAFVQSPPAIDTSAHPLIVANPAGPPFVPGVAQAAQVIGQLFGVTPLLNEQATEAAVRSQAPAASILHLGAHGSFNPQVPLESAIQLQPDSDDDGRLTVAEVYALDLRQSDLVVLSACETLVNQLATPADQLAVSAGDDLVGLSRAFFYAGTPTVIATLWQVDDAASQLLMERFYTHLKAGWGKAAALQRAQQEVRQQYPDPQDWAGFVLLGDPGAIPTGQPLPPWLPWTGGAGAALLLGAGGWLWWRRREQTASGKLIEE